MEVLNFVENFILFCLSMVFMCFGFIFCGRKCECLDGEQSGGSAVLVI